MDVARNRSNSRRGACVLAMAPGELSFSIGSGPTNHVLAAGESTDRSVAVAVDALDTLAAGWAPTMLKIDVEGFEANVIAGASGLLASNPCKQY